MNSLSVGRINQLIDSGMLECPRDIFNFIARTVYFWRDIPFYRLTGNYPPYIPSIRSWHELELFGLPNSNIIFDRGRKLMVSGIIVSVLRYFGR